MKVKEAREAVELFATAADGFLTSVGYDPGQDPPDTIEADQDDPDELQYMYFVRRLCHAIERAADEITYYHTTPEPVGILMLDTTPPTLNGERVEAGDILEIQEPGRGWNTKKVYKNPLGYYIDESRKPIRTAARRRIPAGKGAK